MLNLIDSLVHKEATFRRRLDADAEDKIVTPFKHFGVFAEAVTRADELCNIIAKTETKSRKQDQVENFKL